MAALLFFTSCEKDAPIDSAYQSNTLSFHLARIDTSKISSDVWAHAGNHPAFERETDEKPIHIRVFAPSNASDFKCYISDSIQYRDSLDLYREISAEFELENEGLFGRFSISNSKKKANRYAIVCFQLDDSLHLSSPILIRTNAKSTDTKNTSDLSIEVTPGGRAFMYWTSSDVARSNNLILISDRTGKVFCGAQTNNDEFLFYNLRNVVQNFTPNLFDPRLVLGESYRLRIYSTDNSGWMRNYRSVLFEADTLSVQTF